ncbi:MAG TPA: amidohydrolase family protein, partial [Terriglobia bacterium]|nr:amidohydrolase family protein [Terriglobia bacterium]
VGLVLTRLNLPLSRTIEMLSLNPQKILRINRWGIFEGSDAHLTVLDLSREWTFAVSQSRSKSRNSPFDGWKLKGKAVGTIVGGKLVYEDRK